MFDWIEPWHWFAIPATAVLLGCACLLAGLHGKLWFTRWQIRRCWAKLLRAGFPPAAIWQREMELHQNVVKTIDPEDVDFYNGYWLQHKTSMFVRTCAKEGHFFKP